MKLLFLVAISLILVAVAPCQKYPKWVWWTPPATVSKAELLGFSRKQIVAMGEDAWHLALDRAEKRLALKGQLLSVDLLVDRGAIIYGTVLQNWNDGLVRKMDRDRQKVWRQLRFDLYCFGMACIALTYHLGDQGTHSLHAPRYLRVRVEQLLLKLLNRPKPHDKAFMSSEALIETLESYRTAESVDRTQMDGSPVNLKRVHESANRAMAHLTSVRRATVFFKADHRRAIDWFVWATMRNEELL